MADQHQVDVAPDPDPRLMAAQEAADALKAACNELPDTLSRGHALAHLDAVVIYAVQAIREEAGGG